MESLGEGVVVVVEDEEDMLFCCGAFFRLLLLCFFLLEKIRDQTVLCACFPSNKPEFFLQDLFLELFSDMARI